MLLLLLLAFAAQTTASYCEKAKFPILSGGSRNEQVTCFVKDEVNQLLIVGGYTDSDDYGPGMQEHGFLYAVDMSGDWQWGNFFYNVSFPLSKITGCHAAEKLAVLGIGN